VLPTNQNGGNGGKASPRAGIFFEVIFSLLLPRKAPTFCAFPNLKFFSLVECRQKFLLITKAHLKPPSFLAAKPNIRGESQPIYIKINVSSVTDFNVSQKLTTLAIFCKDFNNSFSVIMATKIETSFKKYGSPTSACDQNFEVMI